MSEKQRYFKQNKIDIRVEQGYEVGRPSLLLLKAQEDRQGKIDGNIGGKAMPVATGELL